MGINKDMAKALRCVASQHNDGTGSVACYADTYNQNIQKGDAMMECTLRHKNAIQCPYFQKNYKIDGTLDCLNDIASDLDKEAKNEQ